jgi:hypothetical protein
MTDELAWLDDEGLVEVVAKALFGADDMLDGDYTIEHLIEGDSVYDIKMRSNYASMSRAAISAIRKHLTSGDA